MSIKYDVMQSPFHEEKYYPRPVSRTTRSLRSLIECISNSTTVSSADVKAVLDAIVSEVISGLQNGDRVSLDNFVEFRPRLQQALDSADDTFEIESGGKLLISAIVKPELTRRLRAKVTFEKLPHVTKQPIIETFTDARTGRLGVYSPGGNARIIGNHLQIFDPGALNQGVFFIGGHGQQLKANTLQDNGERKLTFEIPALLSGKQKVEVRTQYTPTGRIRIGQLGDLLIPA